MIDYHRELLSDETRTRTYRDAIRATVKPGDVVVDIGTGTGILSFFACEAGAARVYAIDRGHMADVAHFMARHLGFADRIQVIHDPSTNVELPERADVLITEIMGSVAFDENILSAVLDARRGLLREGAAIVPQHVALSIAPVELPEVYAKHIEWWGTPRYDLDLTPMRVFAANSIGLIRIAAEAYAAKPAVVAGIDLRTFESKVVSGRTTFTADRDATLHGFGAAFEATLAEGIAFSTRGRDTPSWSQAFLPLEQPLRVARGEAIEVEVETDDGRVWRWRGKAGGAEFDQTTLFAAPPCIAGR